jgi:hypothetical protein
VAASWRPSPTTGLTCYGVFSRDLSTWPGRSRERWSSINDHRPVLDAR